MEYDSATIYHLRNIDKTLVDSGMMVWEAVWKKDVRPLQVQGKNWRFKWLI